MLKCGPVRQKVVNRDITTVILYDKWRSFIAEYVIVNVEINKSKVNVLVQNKLVRRNVYFLRIANKNYPSFLKASKQHSTGYLPPVINTCNISRTFLEFIMVDILDSIFWYECINSNSLERSEVQTSNVKNVSNSTTAIIDNSPVLSSKYPLIESLSMRLLILKSIFFV